MTRHTPQTQTKTMLDWFESVGVKSLDIHLRVPKRPGVGYEDPHWFWITEHEDAPAESVHLELSGWLRHKNATGADIYIRPHGRVPQPVIFLDDIEIGTARRVSQKYSSCVIETSPGNTQVWVATAASLTPAERKRAQSHLCGLGYTDPGSISGDHLGRLCGMRSQKRGCWVNYVCGTKGLRYRPSLKDAPTSIPQGGPCASKSKTVSLDLSTSAREFGWVLGRLRIGMPKEVVLRDLARQAEDRGMRAYEGYAARTIENAIKELDMR